MKGTAKSKVVTSGRLTAGVKVQPARRRVTPNPGPAARPEPAYSLYSTDSEDQVSSLHKGLDRCAALLGGILQAEKAEASPSRPRAVKGGAAKSRPSTSLGRKTGKKLPTKTDQRSWRGPGSTAPTAPPTGSKAKLRPPQERPHTLPQPRSPPPRGLSPAALPPQTSIPRTDSQAASEAPQHARCEAECGGEEEEEEEEEEFVPVRDIDAQSAATHSCVAKMPNMQLGPGQVDEVPRDCGAETEVKKVVQDLLGELKALIAGQGSVAERLLSHLEQAVSSSLINVGSSNIQTTEPDLSLLHSQNTQLRRRVRILNQQLKEREKAERQRDAMTLCNSEVLTLQEELAAAQARLQGLQEALAEERKALQDARGQLRGREAENALIATDLKATKSRWLDSEQQKSELASLAQQRLEEIGKLNRILQSRDLSEPPTERITQYLMSLGQPEPTHAAAGREGNAPEPKKPTPARPRDASPRGGQSRRSGEVGGEERRLSSTVSRCDAESVWSDWSAGSGSAAFRDGLAALDASIASLQKTIQLDLGR